MGSASELPVHWFLDPMFRPSRSFASASAPRYAQPYFAMKNSQGDTLRVHLAKSRDFVGIRSTRCQRKYNEDRYKVLVLNPPTLSPELASLEQSSPSSSSSTTTAPPVSASPTKNGSNNNNNSKSTEGTQMDADQKTLFYFSIFDGHGGSHAADYLTAHLDETIETAQPEMVPQVIRDLRKLGGYFRSFRPHFLEPFLPADFEERYGSRHSATERAKQQQHRVQIKGKGGQVKPMIFIPHPNATEEEQDQALKSLQSGSGGDGHGDGKVVEHKRDQQDHQEPKPVTEATASGDDSDKAGTQSAGTGMEEKKDQQGKIEDEGERYDEDEDPYVIARRRHLNKTSPLPGGTTSYFGTDRSEYEQLTMLQGNDDDSEAAAAAKKKLLQEPEKVIPATMTLEQRLCLSFLKCDTDLIREKYRDGSTASVVIVQSKGAFWETQEDLDLILGHVGDTRILLCEAPRGESIQLTTDHHPDAVVEADRIRKMAAYVTADSFGENMFLGQLANTRALGDIAMKPFGVSAEPEIVRRTVKAKEAAFLVLMSDGISSVMSNQEVVDCVKLEDNPTQAAANLLNLAEQLGAEDNCTVMVVRLPAWGAEMPDLSKELREYRWQSEAQQARARRR
ncbi:hypothetical protein KVV02_008422 [Mortierella alpina]|uniref:PPM-type phosphatase domain-containing protein n=1 Tax=Mortierella alpina TaxID=64518 RepID=A0A9P8D1X8_MORAP|nr:hypothetical protein KVV02_008422 [Mortierella alpina]